MSRNAILGLALGAALTAAPLQGQSDLPVRLSPAIHDTLQHLVDSARAARLPAELLVAKASEGVLKGADDARILRAVRILVRQLSDARLALPAGASTSTLSAAASALHAGVTLPALRRLASGHAASDSDLAVALITLADLVASSVPPDAATSSIEQLLKRRTTEAEMSAFRAAVARDIDAGRAPEMAVTTRTRALTRP